MKNLNSLLASIKERLAAEEYEALLVKVCDHLNEVCDEVLQITGGDPAFVVAHLKEIAAERKAAVAKLIGEAGK